MLLLPSRPHQVLLSIPVIAMAGGCVLFDSTIKLEHASSNAVVALSAPKVGLDVRMSAPQLDSSRQGVKKNGYAMETANVFTDPAPVELVHRVMCDDLARAGYQCEVARVNPRISVDIHQLCAEPAYWSSELYAAVEATVTVVLDGPRAYRRRFKGLGTVPVIWAWSDEKYREAYEEALGDFLQKSVPEIAKLLRQPASPASVWRALPTSEAGDPS